MPRHSGAGLYQLVQAVPAVQPPLCSGAQRVLELQRTPGGADAADGSRDLHRELYVLEGAGHPWYRRSATYSSPGDPFDYNNDYFYLPFDRRHIFNAAYSYVFGNLVHNHALGEVANGWEVSGIFSYQSSGDLQSLVSSNFA